MIKKLFAGHLILITFTFAAMVTSGIGADLVLRDQVVAAVENIPITLREARLMASLQTGKPVDETSGQVLRDVIERMVEQEIIWQEIKGNPDILDVKANMERMRRIFTTVAGGEDQLNKILGYFDVGPEEWEQILRRQSMIYDFVESRFQPFIYISPEEIRQYYEQTLVPSLSDPSQAPPLKDVRGEIIQVLQEKKINAELFDWLERRKSELHVKILPLPNSGNPPEGASSGQK